MDAIICLHIANIYYNLHLHLGLLALDEALTALNLSNTPQLCSLMSSRQNQQ